MLGNYSLLLDKSSPFGVEKVKLLDQVVSSFYSNDPNQVQVSFFNTKSKFNRSTLLIRS